ncbi:Uncharacterized protein TCAP_06888 [Tolypocladium capitatum]|uniref:Uncharacterized protein n=1 Tax=Tolypocladium capitatum TaxID=45235 RepID=A0A2K3Q6Q4_9HYPO|nr:Uncharacterized protein TCAP_06888 [Tolypocladium capitatum]
MCPGHRSRGCRALTGKLPDPAGKTHGRCRNSMLIIWKPEAYEEAPKLTGSLASLSPSKFNDDSFRKFERGDAQAYKEREITSSVIPILEGDIRDRRCVAGEIPFTNLAHLTDGTLVVPGNPDLYYGARPEQIDKAIREDLNHHIVPTTQHDLPVVPNNLLQAKGPDGKMSVALAARGIHSLQSYKLSEPLYDNKAYTISSIYHGGQLKMLKMFASHPIPPSSPDEQPAFATTQLRAFALTNGLNTLIQGATAFRNGREIAEQYRAKAIEQAKARAREEAAATPPRNNGLVLSFTSGASAEETLVTSQDTGRNTDFNIASSYESDTSANELSLDFHPIKRSKSLAPEKRVSNDETARVPRRRGKRRGV